jgi:hypothetical protein
LRWGLTNFLPGLVWNLNPPDLCLQVGLQVWAIIPGHLCCFLSPHPKFSSLGMAYGGPSLLFSFKKTLLLPSGQLRRTQVTSESTVSDNRANNVILKYSLKGRWGNTCRWTPMGPEDVCPGGICSQWLFRSYNLDQAYTWVVLNLASINICCHLCRAVPYR